MSNKGIEYHTSEYGKTKMKVLHQSGDDIIERECRSHLVEDDVGMLLDHFNRCCMG